MTPMEDLPFTIPSLRDAYAAGIRPAAVVNEVFRRIDKVGDAGIFIHLADREELLAEAEALGAFDPGRPLFGIPFAIKDNIDAAGMPTTAACPAFAYGAKADAFVVRRLRDEGALLIGKTNLDQFATGLVGVRSPYPPPKNALDPSMVPGGSSSGSAVAVAHGVVSFALGTDTAGSGRVPAALNNIVGLKPTLGALSARGVVPACRTLDTISIFALSVDDAHQVLKTAAAYDREDAFSHPVPVSPLGDLPAAFRIGVPSPDTREFFGDTAAEASFAEVLASLQSLGGSIVDLDFTPFHQTAEMLYQGAWLAERLTVIEHLLRDRPETVHPTIRQIIDAAKTLSAADAFRGLYRLQELKRQILPMLDRIDLIAVPTIPTVYSLADLEADPILPNARLGTYTNFVNLLNLCAIAVPTGPRPDGRPGSVTLLAGAGFDSWTASVARQIERVVEGSPGATGWPPAVMPSAAPMVMDGEFALAVCGAHMSGLPLNKALTARRARFLRTAETAPSYRLFALQGDPPARPGLLRVGGGDGVKIPLEIWAMPLSEVGIFLQGIAAPLGIGSIDLADGSLARGFLCESAAMADALDISSIGGWRAYLHHLDQVRP